MKTVTDLAELDALYGTPGRTALDKVVTRLTPAYRAWIAASRFCILSTAGPDGIDASPRGDDGPVVRILDDRTLWLPDWRGNNRLDSLRNIVRDGRASLMFFAPGSGNVVRVNGTAAVTVDAAATATFGHEGRHPRSVIVIEIAEAYFQCAKAIMRAELWSGAHVAVPSAGDFLRERIDGFDAAAYDSGYPAEARTRLW